MKKFIELLKRVFAGLLILGFITGVIFLIARFLLYVVTILGIVAVLYFAYVIGDALIDPAN